MRGSMYKASITLLIAFTALLSFFNFGKNKSEEKTNESISKAPPKDWKKFIPATGKFTAFLPNQPSYAIDIEDIPNTEKKRWYEVYVSEEINGKVFLINLITYPHDYQLSDPPVILENIVKDIISRNLNNHIVEIKDDTFRGLPAKYFNFKNQSIEVRGEAFLSNNTVYLLTYTALADDFDTNEFTQFVNSFELTKHENPKL
jgi:hypothetical protein